VTSVVTNIVPGSSMNSIINPNLVYIHYRRITIYGEMENVQNKIHETHNIVAVAPGLVLKLSVEIEIY
jgi:hypothetical protein